MTPTSPIQLDSLPQWANWLTQRPGIGLMFAWGFAEGTLFFILPDVPLSLAALYHPRRALVHVAAIVAGAMLAGAVMFSWSAHSPAARRAVARVPLVRPAMFVRASSDYREFGMWAVSIGPARGIPYKVYAVEAPAHLSEGSLLLATIPGRLWRLLLVWLGSSFTGLLLRKFGRASLTPAVCALFWTIVYVAYWAKVR